MTGPPRRQWEKLLERAGLSELHIHDLRRTLGSWISNTGASTVMTMRALGHRSIDAALIYQQSEIDPVRNAMQRGVAGFLQAAKTGKAEVIELRPRKTRKKSAGRAGGR